SVKQVAHEHVGDGDHHQQQQSERREPQLNALQPVRRGREAITQGHVGNCCLWFETRSPPAVGTWARRHFVYSSKNLRPCLPSFSTAAMAASTCGAIICFILAMSASGSVIICTPCAISRSRPTFSASAHILPNSTAPAMPVVLSISALRSAG